MSDHVVNVVAVDRGRAPGGAATPVAYRFACSCGSRGEVRVAAKVTAKAANEARDSAATDGIRHRRERLELEKVSRH